MASFQFPQWRPSAIWSIQNMQILTFPHFYSHNLHINGKFCRDRMNGSGDFANLRFSIWRPSAILNCGNMLILNFRIVCGPNLHAHAELCRDRMNGYSEFSIFNMAAAPYID